MSVVPHKDWNLPENQMTFEQNGFSRIFKFISAVMFTVDNSAVISLLGLYNKHVYSCNYHYCNSHFICKQYNIMLLDELVYQTHIYSYV
jgi:hypothetical protein